MANLPRDSQNEPTIPYNPPAKKRSCFSCLLILVVISLPALHLYGCLPTSRLGKRNFVLNRDYKDMGKIFGVDPIPGTFNIEAVRYPSGRGGMTDGPLPVMYKVTVAGRDYYSLIRSITSKPIPINSLYGRLSAVQHFNPAFWEQLHMLKWDPPIASDGTTITVAELFENPTRDKDGYTRNSYVLSDLRSSDPVTLYITTEVPYYE